MADVKGATIFNPGDVLNNTYRIEAILGRGGTSEVYRARSEISGRVVALKALRSEYAGNEDYLALMTREEDMREIRHDGVVRYYHNQRTEDGTVYLVMDYVDGPSMEQMMRKGGMPAADLLVLAQRVAEALGAAHARKIVHRDLSPDNIILRGGDPADAVIIDFGIAKDTRPGAETIVGNEFAGKYAYAAPEQLSGNTDARSDLYALGALLLATFRGKAPNVGANPMEVVTNKGKPLDTDGVPEPLRGLIDRLAAPNRDARFQTAGEVVSFLQASPAAGDDEERTVIVPRARTEVPARPATFAPAASPRKEAAAPPTPAKPEKGRGGMVAGLLVLVLIAALGGGYAMGLFKGVLGPSYPLADPFVLVAERSEAGAVQAVGSVPTEADLTAISDRIEAAGGAPALTLASGAVAPDWGAGIAGLLDAVKGLPEWRVAASGNEVKVSGLTLDAAEQTALSAAVVALGAKAGLNVIPAIELGPRFLSADVLAPVLVSASNCGVLQLVDPPATGYPMGGTVAVRGKIADVASQVALADALTALIGQRQLALDLEVLNPTLCTIDAALPKAPSGGFEVVFGFGERADPNPTGRYFVGENPVIDVVIPADVTEGYLYVSALDVSGNVFHLLPNLNRTDDSIASLRGGQTGPVTVRVAYSIAERDASSDGKLAFVVDETSLGKTKIIVLTSEQPLFASLRPTTESASGYAQALAGLAVPVRTLDSRILTTAKP